MNIPVVYADSVLTETLNTQCKVMWAEASPGTITLSHILFTIYMNALFVELRKKNGYIGDAYVGDLDYTDDVTLLSLTHSALKSKLHIADRFSK